MVDNELFTDAELLQLAGLTEEGDEVAEGSLTSLMPMSNDVCVCVCVWSRLMPLSNDVYVCASRLMP